MKLSKKLASILCAAALLISALPAAAAAEVSTCTTEDKSLLNEVRQSYLDDHCFYQVTDADYLESLTDDDVIEIFHNIRITKRMLTDDLILDINKVTESDIVSETRTLGTASVMRVFPTEERLTLSSEYDNVTVIKEAVDNTTGYQPITVYQTILYLSNEGIDNFIVDSWVGNLGQTIQTAFGNMVAGLTMCFVKSKTFNVLFSLITGAGQLGQVSLDYKFKSALADIYRDGGRAVVSITSTSQSCSVWSDRYFYIENAYRNGLDISSAYRCYTNK